MSTYPVYRPRGGEGLAGGLRRLFNRPRGGAESTARGKGNEALGD